MKSKDINLDLIRKEFEKIISHLHENAGKSTVIHEVEKNILKEVLSLSLLLLQYYTNLVFKKEKVKNKERKKEGLKNCGLSVRLQYTIFGVLEIYRTKFYDTINKKVVYPFDIEYKLGTSKFSYTLQDFIGKAATENTYEQSVTYVNKIFGLDFAPMQSERIVTNLSTNVDKYYEQKDNKKQVEGKYFAAGFDDKGVSIKAGSLNREAESNGLRLGKGQKRDVKRHSTVSVTYSFDERVRTAEDVISSLFKEKTTKKIEPLEKQTTAQNKHIRAFMNDKDKTIEYGFNQILRRNGGLKEPIVVLIDGDRGLEHAVNRVSEKMNITNRIEAKILDFIHVTEYVWKSANVNFGEKNAERESWVKEQCKLLLKGEVETVIATIENFLEQHKINAGKKRDLESVIKYFTNHKHMMDYKTYLQKGFPISTGAIESACGHFVQNRMERNGMHWTPDGAQNMLDLRAVNKNNNWEDFMNFIVNLEYKQVA
jgi:hypothetical protein